MPRPTLAELSTRIDDLDTKLTAALALLEERRAKPTQRQVSPKKALYDRRQALSGQHTKYSFWADTERNCVLFRPKGAFDLPWKVWNDPTQ